MDSAAPWSGIGKVCDPNPTIELARGWTGRSSGAWSRGSAYPLKEHDRGECPAKVFGGQTTSCALLNWRRGLAGAPGRRLQQNHDARPSPQKVLR